MLDEFMKALGPWPVLQTILGLAVLGAGVFAIVRGMNKGKDDGDKRAEWAALEQLKHIEENSFKLVEGNARILEALQRLSDNVWNRKQFKD